MIGYRRPLEMDASCNKNQIKNKTGIIRSGIWWWEKEFPLSKSGIQICAIKIGFCENNKRAKYWPVSRWRPTKNLCWNCFSFFFFLLLIHIYMLHLIYIALICSSGKIERSPPWSIDFFIFLQLGELQSKENLLLSRYNTSLNWKKRKKRYKWKWCIGSP